MKGEARLQDQILILDARFWRLHHMTLIFKALPVDQRSPRAVHGLPRLGAGEVLQREGGGAADALPKAAQGAEDSAGTLLYISNKAHFSSVKTNK